MFKVNQKVKCIQPKHLFLKMNEEYTVQTVNGNLIKLKENDKRWIRATRFVAVEEKPLFTEADFKMEKYQTGDYVVCIAGNGTDIVYGQQCKITKLFDGGYIAINGLNKQQWLASRFIHTQHFKDDGIKEESEVVYIGPDNSSYLSPGECIKVLEVSKHDGTLRFYHKYGFHSRKYFELVNISVPVHSPNGELLVHYDGSVSLSYLDQLIDKANEAEAVCKELIEKFGESVEVRWRDNSQPWQLLKTTGLETCQFRKKEKIETVISFGPRIIKVGIDRIEIGDTSLNRDAFFNGLHDVLKMKKASSAVPACMNGIILPDNILIWDGAEVLYNKLVEAGNVPPTQEV